MLISDAGQPIKISVATANQNADIGRWSANKNICSDRAHVHVNISLATINLLSSAYEDI